VKFVGKIKEQVIPRETKTIHGQINHQNLRSSRNTCFSCRTEL